MITSSKLISDHRQADGRRYITEEHTDDYFGTFRVCYLGEVNTNAAVEMSNRASVHNDVGHPGAQDEITLLCEDASTPKFKFPNGSKRTQSMTFYQTSQDKNAIDRTYTWLMDKNNTAIRHWNELRPEDKQLIIQRCPNIGKLIDLFSRIL
jgi:hypothetical protein